MAEQERAEAAEIGMAETIGQMILFGLINPLIALPAFILGWIARRWWLVPAGAVAIAALFTSLSILDFNARPDVAADSEILWAALPFTLVPTLAWCGAGFFLGRWQRSRRDPEARALVRVASILAGLLLGAVLGAAAGLGLGELYVSVARVSSFEGLAGYVVVFLFIAPGVLVGAASGALAGAMLHRRLAGPRITPG